MKKRNADVSNLEPRGNNILNLFGFDAHLAVKNIRREDEFTLLANFCKSDKVTAMKFVMAIFVFLLFAALLTGGIVLLLHGQPGLLIFALLVFFGTFIKYGCLSH